MDLNLCLTALLVILGTIGLCVACGELRPKRKIKRSPVRRSTREYFQD